MNPKEFSWTEDQQVTVTNPTQKDFKFKVHSKGYEVKAGETVKMPGYIAWQYVHSLAFQMIQDDGEVVRWNEEGFRKQYHDQIVVGTDELIQKIEEEPEIILEKVKTPAKTEDKKPAIKPMTANKTAE